MNYIYDIFDEEYLKELGFSDDAIEIISMYRRYREDDIRAERMAWLIGFIIYMLITYGFLISIIYSMSR